MNASPFRHGAYRWMRLARILAVVLALAPSTMGAAIANRLSEPPSASERIPVTPPEEPRGGASGSNAADNENERLEVVEGIGVAEPAESRESATAEVRGREAVDTGGRGSEGPLEIARDPQDRAFRAGEIIIIASRADADVIGRMGFPIVERRRLSGLGDYLLRIGLPLSVDPVAFQTRLAATVPQAVFDFDHVYRLADRASRDTTGVSHADAWSVGEHGLVGIVDAPVDRLSPGLTPNVIEAKSFAPNPPPSVKHGTAVAYLASRGGARVLAANVFSRAPAGAEVASMDAMARAMDWLVAKGVTVINMSLEGPPNRVLGEVVRRVQAKGCVVVAAAGNGGPAAPPAYPAAYPSVVAVTAVDAAGAIYTYANRGNYITFSALGVDVRTPVSTSKLSGTSYAAPVVAGLVARRMRRQDIREAAAVVELLKLQAKHIGRAGRDPIYGYGVLEY